MKIGHITLAVVALVSASCGKKTSDSPSQTGPMSVMETVDLSNDFETIVGTDVSVASQNFSLASEVDATPDVEADAAIIQKEFDEDGDGVMGPAELGEANKAFEEARKKHDTNKDGTMDASERKTAHEVFKSKCKAARDEMLLKMFDANKDGKLDESEMQVAKMARKFQVRATHGNVKGRVKEFDADKDGKLSQEEVVAMKAKMKSEYEAKSMEKFKSIDTNGDGKIDETEFMAHRKSNEDKIGKLRKKFGSDQDGRPSREECEKERERMRQKSSPETELPAEPMAPAEE